MKVLSSITREGFLYRIDLRLRPDGQSGPLEQRAGHDLNYIAMTGVLDQIRADGKLATYLRNPERNQGVYLGVTRIEPDGDGFRYRDGSGSVQLKIS